MHNAKWRPLMVNHGTTLANPFHYLNGQKPSTHSAQFSYPSPTPAWFSILSAFGKDMDKHPLPTGPSPADIGRLLPDWR